MRSPSWRRPRHVASDRAGSGPQLLPPTLAHRQTRTVTPGLQQDHMEVVHRKTASASRFRLHNLHLIFTSASAAASWRCRLFREMIWTWPKCQWRTRTGLTFASGRELAEPFPTLKRLADSSSTLGSSRWSSILISSAASRATGGCGCGSARVDERRFACALKATRMGRQGRRLAPPSWRGRLLWSRYRLRALGERTPSLVEHATAPRPRGAKTPRCPWT